MRQEPLGCRAEFWGVHLQSDGPNGDELFVVTPALDALRVFYFINLPPLH
jgi:hypothetical protein